MMRRIGIFGGTFNPIHNGHLLAISEFQHRLQLDLVLVIPAAVPPHKQLPARSASSELRMQMTQAATADLPYVTVSDIELNRSGPSYTADTLRELKAQYPDDQLFLLVGTDQFLAIDQWREPEAILGLAELVCFHRESGDSEELIAQQNKLREQFNARTRIVENDFVEMSSSTIRRMAAFNCAESYVHPAVLAIMAEHHLYGMGVDRKNLPFEQLKQESLSVTKAKRVPHIIGTCETAVLLAERFGADTVIAARAGILHDVTKALDGPEQLKLCQKYQIELNPFEQKNDKLLHAKTGAAVAEHIFGENELVCDAIYWHTTGKADMTLLEKILYIADYMEPNRDFDGVEVLRKLLETDLDAAMLAGFEMSLELLTKRGKEIDANSQAARDYLLRERNKQ